MAAVLPRYLRIGGGSVKELGAVLKQCGISKPLIVTDPYLAGCGMVDRVVGLLKGETPTVGVFSDTIPDPTSDSIASLAAFLQGEGAAYDGLVAVGGGSPMDTAKGALALNELGGHMRDYKVPVLTDAPFKMPLVCVPTTAGTGSECTRFTAVTDSETGEKMRVVGDAYVPIAAVCDWELTLGAPKALTADTGVDALCHAMEAYVSSRRNAFADGMALDALKNIGPALHGAVEDDPAGREHMMLGAFQAGVAFSSSSVTLIHGMSRPLGAHFHIAHGRSNAVLAPAVTAFSYAGERDRYDVCAAALGYDGHLPDALAKLNQDLGVPSLYECLRDMGIDDDAYAKAIPTMAQEALGSGSPDYNPVIADAAGIEQLYADIYAEGKAAAAS